MSPGERPKTQGVRAIYGLLALIAAGVALFYADRVFYELPVYAAAEAGHLISALYGPALAAHPDLFPDLAQRREPAFDLLIRAVTYATQNLVPWMRVGGGLAYFAGLGCVFLAVRPSLDRRRALAFALLALAFPYYRFAFAVLPTGWTVALIGLAILATARLVFVRPLAHAAAVGAICGLLCMMGPHGLALAAAFLLLALADLALGRRDLRIFAGRIVVFALALLACANLVLLLADQPLDAPFSSFLDPHLMALAGGLDPQAASIGGRAFVAMAAASLMLAGAPALTGLLRIELRWRWTRKRTQFHLEPLEAAFLLAALALAASLVLIALLAMADGADPARIWGRQFEFFTPLLWLAAAPFLREFERGGGRWWRIAVSLTALIGLAGFAGRLLTGAAVRAWDAAALDAFSDQPQVLAPLACGVIVLAALAMFSGRLAVERVWIGAFVALGVLSTIADAAWRADETPSRLSLIAEATAANALASGRPGQVTVLAQDVAQARLIYWRLRGRPEAVIVSAGAPDPASLAHADMVVADRPATPGPGWRALLHGREISVFVRDGAGAPPARAKPTRVGGLLSAPGSG
jgi:hypothetical protein